MKQSRFPAAMVHAIDNVLVGPGDAVTFRDRDDLLKELDRREQPVPARHEGRSQQQREHFCMLRYLRLLVGEGLLPLPVTLKRPPLGGDPPDFIVEWPDGRKETFELTDGSTREYQRALSLASKTTNRMVLPVDVNTPEKEAARLWAEIIFHAFRAKAEGLVRGRFDLDHLLVYDLTGLGLLLPLDRGASLLKEMLLAWYATEKPSHRFRQVSVLRDLALLLDAGGGARIIPLRDSPFYRLPVIRARGEEDLKRRLRELDRYCRENSIRHLKPFGSILGNTAEPWEGGDLDLPLFREDDSDLDLLVEFEPGTRVTLLDMARMERELGELTGFKVDLRTAGDLSRYFRREVLQEAVELHASER